MATSPTPIRQPNPGVILETLNAYQQSAALKAAIELDLFTQIAHGHRTVDALANALSASTRGVRILCDFLVIHGLLEKSGKEYALTPDSAAFLDRNSPAYFGSVSGFLLDPRVTDPFSNLAEVVRTGTTTLPGEGTVSHDNPVWVEFARSMVPMMFPAGKEMAALLAGTAPIRVLDIAAGHGMFGILLAQQNPHAHITALDWPNVLAVATENAVKFGVAGRHTLVPGSAFDADFGGPYDLILVTNFFHHFDQPTCEQLMRKIHAALAPAGKCATLEFVPNDDRVSPPPAATFAMVMLGTTASGDAYTFAEYQTMFANAGFTSSSAHPLQHSPETVVLSHA